MAPIFLIKAPPELDFAIARGFWFPIPSMTPTEALIILNMAEHVGPVTVRRLMDRFGTAETILNASAAQLQAVDGVPAKAARSIADWRRTVPWEEEFKAIQKHHLRVLIPSDPDYPVHLKEIHDPPLALYTRGRLEGAEKNSVAIIGSRQTTHYGQETARQLGFQLGNIGMSVVSGLARGIDTAAHRGCLQAKGHTVAVLGFGFDYLSKAENGKLADEIVEAGGAILSEFPCSRPPDRQTFPMRNRIVSGMTLGSLVVEAGIKSGALITAHFALEQGRQVFAVPGRISSPQSQGCHQLIQNGAKLVQCVEDVIEEFEHLIPRGNHAAEMKPEKIFIQLTETEKTVFSSITHEETPIDVIMAASELPPSVVSATLMVLEMKRAVRQLPGKLYLRTAG